MHFHHEHILNANNMDFSTILEHQTLLLSNFEVIKSFLPFLSLNSKAKQNIFEISIQILLLFAYLPEEVNFSKDGEQL